MNGIRLFSQSGYRFALLASIIPNQNNFGITTVLAIPHDEAAGTTEELKARNPMRWAGLMNTLKAQVEEVLLQELVYI